jgi:hypothetical protein
MIVVLSEQPTGICTWRDVLGFILGYLNLISNSKIGILVSSISCVDSEVRSAV